jgi:signal transduction histidine kinase
MAVASFSGTVCGRISSSTHKKIVGRMTEAASVLLEPIIAILAGVLSVLFWLRGTKQFRKYFVSLTFLVSLLALTYMGEMFSPDLQSKMYWNMFEYVSITIIPLLYLIIVVRYAGREDLLTRRNIMLISAIPLIGLLMVWTNDFHHLFYESTFLAPGQYQAFDSVDGPFFYLHTLYCFGLEFAAIGIVAVAFIRSPKVQRSQVGLMVISAVAPTAIIVLSLVNLIPIPIVDATLIGFFLDGIVLYLAVYHYGLFYATPLVLNSIADIMQDGAIMLNQEGMVTYLNSSAEKLVHPERGYLLGKPIGSVLPELHAAIGEEENGSEIIEMTGPSGNNIRLEVRYSTVLVDRKKVGQLLILRDVTTLRRTEEALASSNSKLNVLYGVTRHDILNRISVIRGYGQLLMDKTDVRSPTNDYLKKMMDSTVAIEHLINFTRDYEKVGIVSPEWQNVGRVFQKAKVLCAEQGVEYVIETGPLEIFADPMLERFFYILLDNTNRHGSKVTKVSITAKRSVTGYSIFYHDNGIGIRSDDKAKIFLKGFGNDSGLGLYLGMQILGITGIGIKENGEPSKGARFEITVPDGKWRVV